MQEEEADHYKQYKTQNCLEEHAQMEAIVGHSGAAAVSKVKYKIKWQHSEQTSVEPAPKVRKLCGSNVSTPLPLPPWPCCYWLVCCDIN